MEEKCVFNSTEMEHLTNYQVPYYDIFKISLYSLQGQVGLRPIY